MTKPYWFFKVSGNAPKHKRQVFPLWVYISSGWTPLDQALPCVIGNDRHLITLRGRCLPLLKSACNTYSSHYGFFLCLLILSVSKGCFSEGTGRGRKTSFNAGRFCSLKQRPQRVETNQSYLPGYSWIQIALELLNVCMRRILHLEPFL